MAALSLTLKAAPPERVDLAPLTATTLTGRSPSEIARIVVGTTRAGLTVGDLFDIAGDDPTDLHISGHERLDNIGKGLSGGSVTVEGDTGAYLGRGMKGGTIRVSGSVRGPYAGTGMTGGSILVAGDAADAVGGAVPGAMAGQAGGLIVIRGSAGIYVGDRMRRGVLVVEGYVGDACGARMVGGTILTRALGTRAGAGMKRGTLIAPKSADLEPTFVPSGTYALPFLSILRTWLKDAAPGAVDLVPTAANRFRGDMAALGKGEILVG